MPKATPIKKSSPMEKFATKKELERHKKDVEKMIKNAVKGVKKWDVKQDKTLLKKSKAKVKAK